MARLGRYLDLMGGGNMHSVSFCPLISVSRGRDMAGTTPD